MKKPSIYDRHERCRLKGQYHPFAEYHKAFERFRRTPYVPGGKFHKLAMKIEATLPRGYREHDAFTTSLLLEIDNEEKGYTL